MSSKSEDKQQVKTMIFKAGSTFKAQLVDDSFANSSIWINESSTEMSFATNTKGDDDSMVKGTTSTVECHQFSVSCLDAPRVKEFQSGAVVSSSHTCPSVEEVAEEEEDGDDESSVSVSSSTEYEVASDSSSCASFASDGLLDEIGQLLKSPASQRTASTKSESASSNLDEVTAEATSSSPSKTAIDTEAGGVVVVSGVVQFTAIRYEIHKPTRCEQRPQPRRRSDELSRGTWHGGALVTDDRTRRDSLSRAGSFRRLQVLSKAADTTTVTTTDTNSNRDKSTGDKTKKTRRRKALQRAASCRQFHGQSRANTSTTTVVPSTGEVKVARRRGGSLSQSENLRQLQQEGGSTTATTVPSTLDDKVSRRRTSSLSRAQSLRDLHNEYKSRETTSQKPSSLRGQQLRESTAIAVNSKVPSTNGCSSQDGIDMLPSNTSPRGPVDSSSGETSEKLHVCKTPRRPRSSGKLLVLTTRDDNDGNDSKAFDLTPPKPQSLGKLSLHSKQQQTPQWSSPRMSALDQNQVSRTVGRQPRSSRRRRSMKLGQQEQQQHPSRPSLQRASSDRHLLQRQIGSRTLDVISANGDVGIIAIHNEPQRTSSDGSIPFEPRSLSVIGGSSATSPPMRPTLQRSWGGSSERNLLQRQEGARKLKTTYGPPSSRPSSTTTSRSSLERGFSERGLMPKQRSSRKLLQSPPSSNEGTTKGRSEEFQAKCRTINITF